MVLLINFSGIPPSALARTRRSLSGTGIIAGFKQRI